ncbi:hypothetical protein [Lentzea sp. NPDC051838]|uniref:hypothetical protein n=1 Tax=Lentzea sp. NPDC051838 TaxID=3154849 RepID=UPI003422DD44
MTEVRVFLATGDDEMMELLADTAAVMVSELGISRAEAVARINEYWSTRQQLLDNWMAGHEAAEYWAFYIYFAEDTPVREWRTADRSSWVPDPAPPRSSGFWTV